MTLQVLIYNILSDLARAPRSVPNAPEVPAPVALLQAQMLLQKLSCTATFDPPHDLADRMLRQMRHVQMHVIAADNTFNDADIKSVANLTDQVTAALLDLTTQHMVAILGMEDPMYLQLVDAMAAFSLLHTQNLQKQLLKVSC